MMLMFKFKIRVWLENNGEFMISSGRAELLESIHETGSITGAAEKLGFSYRHAWGILRKISSAAGTPVVKSERGGKGGKTMLTPAGKKILQSYSDGIAKIRKALKGREFVID
jgi:molybdate transport system regulatory protein